ncbi:MAG: glycerol-3-phosphate dehydrogenase/oxidase [Methylococcaceae bacterium]|nr:glycerol-3-phosphate dehydrogenase/oxidase [Methylococcaceae bacterium]
MQRSQSPAQQEQFDLLVCGGGIYGAWTAYDAALRGLKVIIVDQGDWASGTSSASSKLIHGGLRYLETMDFGVVKKSLVERQRLIDAAPYRVWPLRFGVPVNKGSRIGTLRLKIGLSIYDILAGTSHSQQTHQHFDAETFSHRFPYLDTKYLKSGFTYLDAQTDDARFVLEIIDGACAAGATCLNYCQVTDILQENDIITGAVLSDKISGDNYTIQTSAVVTTTGHWLSTSHPEKQWCRLSKGVHLILPKVLDKEALLLTARSDGRVFFIIPWYGLTLLGTTDTDYKGDINNLTVDKEDIDYLLNEANLALTTHWTEKDIQGQFVGLRVLQHSTLSSPSKITREWELKSEKTGLFHSIGGKLTSSREDGEKIVNAVCEYLANNTTSKTGITSFPWLPEGNFKIWSINMTAKAHSIGIDSESTLWLLRRHGNRVAEIFYIIEKAPHLAERITTTVPLIVADLIFCLKHEMVFHLEDLLRRRIPIIILYRMTEAELIQIAAICAKTLKWDLVRQKAEVKACTQKWLLH